MYTDIMDVRGVSRFLLVLNLLDRILCCCLHSIVVRTMSNNRLQDSITSGVDLVTEGRILGGLSRVSHVRRLHLYLSTFCLRAKRCEAVCELLLKCFII